MSSRVDAKLIQSLPNSFQSWSKVFQTQSKVFQTHSKVFQTQSKVFQTQSKVFQSHPNSFRVFQTDPRWWYLSLASEISSSSFSISCDTMWYYVISFWQYSASWTRGLPMSSRVDAKLIQSLPNSFQSWSKVFQTQSKVFQTHSKVFQTQSKVFQTQSKVFQSHPNSFRVFQTDPRWWYLSLASEISSSSFSISCDTMWYYVISFWQYSASWTRGLPTSS